MTYVLGAFFAVLVGLALLTAARVVATRALEGALDHDGGLPDDLTDRRALLLEGHPPPPGLSPLSPGERFQAERGRRQLQVGLHDHAA